MLEISAVRPENHNIVTITMAGELNEAFLQRRAGQFALLEIPDSGDRPHPFTLSGSPEAPELQMTIKNVGRFTSRVHRLKAGDKVSCQGPFGKFCSDIEEQSNITMIAGGIGITPFLSVLRHFRERQIKKSIQLFWANNTEDDFFCLSEFQSLAQELSLTINLVSLEGYSKQNGQWAEGERIHYYIGYLKPDIFPKELKETAIYLCGSQGMQDFALEQLGKLGVDPGQVEKEKIIGG